jgi:polyisoprenoid-binding protein YceI
MKFGRLIIARGLCAGLAIAAVAASAATGAAATLWSLDPARTHIGFEIEAVGYSPTKGAFHRFEGRITVDFEHPERSNVAFHVQSQSVDVGSSSFSDYIRSAVFLDAARFPTIDFVSNEVRKLDDHTIRVGGGLTLLGVTRPLTVDVTVRREPNGSRGKLGFDVETRIDRLEFGMNSGFPLVAREIELKISTEAVPL